MKRFIYVLLFLNIPLLGLAVPKEFGYDKDALSAEFSELEKINIYVEETNSSYSELRSNPKFKDKALTNTIALKPTIKLSDIDLPSFAWGFCCFPVGIFTVLINDDKDKNSKDSFWAGVGSFFIALPVGYVAAIAIILIDDGFFF